MRLRPFFSYYGGKWRAAKLYPEPEYPTIIEPFAGSAGYSVWHHEHKVILNDLNPDIYDLWKFLIEADSSDINKLPFVLPGETLDDEKFSSLSKGERMLIGFSLNSGCSSVRKTPTRWMWDCYLQDTYWSPKRRARIARDVELISHWSVMNVNYKSIPDIEATWFIDPPYDCSAGLDYPYGKNINHYDLGDWCRSRKGQVIVCEQEGADWLDFRPLNVSSATHGKKKKTKEVFWTNS